MATHSFGKALRAAAHEQDVPCHVDGSAIMLLQAAEAAYQVARRSLPIKEFQCVQTEFLEACKSSSKEQVIEGIKLIETGRSKLEDLRLQHEKELENGPRIKKG